MTDKTKKATVAKQRIFEMASEIKRLAPVSGLPPVVMGLAGLIIDEVFRAAMPTEEDWAAHAAQRAELEREFWLNEMANEQARGQV